MTNQESRVIELRRKKEEKTQIVVVKIDDIFPGTITVLVHPDGFMTYGEHSGYPWIKGDVRPIDLLYFRLIGIAFELKRSSTLKHPN